MPGTERRRSAHDLLREARQMLGRLGRYANRCQICGYSAPAACIMLDGVLIVGAGLGVVRLPGETSVPYVGLIPTLQGCGKAAQYHVRVTYPTVEVVEA